MGVRERGEERDIRTEIEGKKYREADREIERTDGRRDGLKIDDDDDDDDDDDEFAS